MTAIELSGIELHGYHGVLPHERRMGQRFLVDLTLVYPAGAPPASDRIADVVDYRDVIAVVQAVSAERRYRLLETFAGALADTLLERFPLGTVSVRVRKPDVELDVAVDHAAVIVERASRDA